MLVVEYGVIEYAPGIFDPPQIIWGGVQTLATTWEFNSLPIPAVENKTALVFVGQVVGGSSAVNGQFFDRGTVHAFDAISQAGSPEFDSSPYQWDWNGIFPFFKKVRKEGGEYWWWPC